MTEKRFRFNGCTNCIEYDGKSILLDSYGEEIEDLLNEQHETIERLKDNCKVLDEVKCEIAEENEQLKKRNEFLKKQLDRVCSENEMMGDKLKKIGRIL